MSDSSEVKTRVCQGCLLSPFLFLHAIVLIDWLMKTTTAGRNTEIQWTLRTDDLDFADDLVLLSHNCNQMQDKSIHLATTSVAPGLREQEED